MNMKSRSNELTPNDAILSEKCFMQLTHENDCQLNTKSLIDMFNGYVYRSVSFASCVCFQFPSYL